MSRHTANVCVLNEIQDRFNLQICPSCARHADSTVEFSFRAADLDSNPLGPEGIMWHNQCYHCGFEEYYVPKPGTQVPPMSVTALMMRSDLTDDEKQRIVNARWLGGDLTTFVAEIEKEREYRGILQGRVAAMAAGRVQMGTPAPPPAHVAQQSYAQATATQIRMDALAQARNALANTISSLTPPPGAGMARAVSNPYIGNSIEQRLIQKYADSKTAPSSLLEKFRKYLK
jgi:hypothetical protein